MKLGRWSQTAASNNNTPPDGWPEGQAPSTVNDCAREMMASIRAAFSDLQFFDQDFTPTYVSATSFTVPGDQTSAIHSGRRLKIYDATAGVATTIYATVATASFTVVTTVSVSCDAGQLTSSLSSFAIAILSKNNPSIPSGLNSSHDRLSASAIETTTLTVSGAAVIKGALTVSGAVAIAGTLSVSGGTVLTTLRVGSTLSADGAATFASTLTVSGALSVLAGQIAFPAAQNPSANANTLDDYEEGTWTPALRFNGSADGLATNVASGFYTKIGRHVFFSFQLKLSAVGTSVGTGILGGLPFTVGGGGFEANALYTFAMSSVSGVVFLQPQVGGTSATFLNANAFLTNTHFTNSSDIRCAGHYFSS